MQKPFAKTEGFLLILSRRTRLKLRHGISLEFLQIL